VFRDVLSQRSNRIGLSSLGVEIIESQPLSAPRVRYAPLPRGR
jgi:hypothetical protein